MKALFESSLAQLLAETLLHSIWQGALLLVLVYLLFGWVKSSNARARYAIGISALMLLIVTNVISFYSLNPNANLTGGISSEPYNGLPILETMGSVGNSLLPIETSPFLLSCFMIFWVSGLVLLSLRFSLKFFQAQNLKYKGLSAAPPLLEAAFQRLKPKFNISRPVKIMESVAVFTPSVIGHFKPIILFPLGLANGLSTAQVESIIMHELAHIKRNDYLINLLQSFVEVIYFFNPFVWIISRIVRQERENICDDIALTTGVSSLSYARTLAELFQRNYRQRNLSISFSKNNNLTLKRIKRIMKKESNNNSKMLAPLVMVLVIIASIYLGAKSPAGAVFDLADKEMKTLVGASVLPEFVLEPRKLTAEKPVETLNSFPDEVKSEPINPPDTIDREDFKRQLKEYEKSVERLHSSQEWQEMEALRKVVFKQQELLMQEISPEIENALELARKSMELSEVEMLALEERMSKVQDQMLELEVSEEMELALEMKAEALEKVMMEIEAKMATQEFQKLEKLAQKQAEFAIKLEAEALKMAEIADQHADEALARVDNYVQFVDELKPLLVKDGYIEKGDSIEELHFKEGEVWINDKKVKPADAKKYNKLRRKYFDDDEPIFIN